MSRRLLGACLAAGVVVALLVAIPVFTASSPPEITIKPGREGVPYDQTRYFHCRDLERLTGAWGFYESQAGSPDTDMEERIARRYDRECPDSGLGPSDGIKWTADLPPEPPESP